MEEESQKINIFASNFEKQNLENNKIIDNFCYKVGIIFLIITVIIVAVFVVENLIK
jgi:hypothetical protein